MTERPRFKRLLEFMAIFSGQWHIGLRLLFLSMELTYGAIRGSEPFLAHNEDVAERPGGEPGHEEGSF